MFNLFVPSELKSYYSAILSNTKILKDLDTICVPMGCIAIDKNNEAYGVFSRGSTFIPQSLSTRGQHSQHIPRNKFVKKCEYIDADAIYCGGGAFHHFGHFLLEGTNRLYPILDKKYHGCKFVFAGNGKTVIPEFTTTLLTMLGIPESDIMVVNKSTQFKNVYIPQQAFNLPLYSSEIQAQVFQKIADNAPKCDKFEKIYLSRAKMGDRRTFGEEKIQRIFEKNGYKIIYPETLPLPQQIGLIRNCKYLAGLAGTALHLALFMPRGGTVIQIKRNTDKQDNAQVQQLINETVGLDFTLIWGSTEEKPTAHFTSCPQFVDVTKYLKQFFDANNFEYTTPDIAFDKSEYQAYTQQLALWHKQTGHSATNRAKKTIAKICSCFIPGRHRRRYVREKIEKFLDVKQQ